jgi:hypothetical protein
MNCCDEHCSTYGCNQGRNCPARVAKIGRKDHAKAPLPASPWRAYLRDLGRAMLVVVCTWLIGLAAFVALVLSGVIHA